MMNVPVLMLVGEQTDPFRPGVWEQLAGQLKDAPLRVLPGQRHATYQIAPAVLASAISDFIHLVAS